MLMELLFGIMFFILPIVGMFITIIATKLKQANHLNSKPAQQQPVFWDMPKGITKINERMPKRFFKEKTRFYIQRVRRLDTS